MGKFIDLTNARFGRLTALKKVGKNKWKQTLWLCQCDCNKQTTVEIQSLRSGNTNSCGCKQKEHVKGNRYNQKAKGEAGFNDVYSKYKRKALDKNRIFELNHIEFKELVTGNCFYCNKIPCQVSRGSLNRSTKTIEHSTFIYNGIDRVDTTQGYIKSNCVSCCWNCNQSKNKLSLSEFKEHINSVYSFFIEKNPK